MVSVVEMFIDNMEDHVEIKSSESGEDGTMVTLYGLREPSAMDRTSLGNSVVSFIYAPYKA